MTIKPRLPVFALCLVVGACAATLAPTDYPETRPGKATQRELLIPPEVIKLPNQYPAGKKSSLVPQELPSTRQLIGLNRPRLTDILGPPDFRRKDISVEMWQYRNDICILDIFLYRQEADGNFHVEHIEAHDRSVARVTLKDCYLGLLQKHSKENG